MFDGLHGAVNGMIIWAIAGMICAPIILIYVLWIVGSFIFNHISIH